MLFICAGLIVVIVAITRSRNRSSSPRKPRFGGLTLPAGLGLHDDIPLQTIAMQLDQAFDAQFGAPLQQRFLARHPEVEAAEYPWLLLELKRYLLLTALLPNVPMFSVRVDDLWHEMLLHSREYERFCLAFAGRTIHHTPHAEPMPMPDQRAWFDWMYTQLFVVNAYSLYAWGHFFREPLARDLIEQFRTRGEDALLSSFFYLELAEAREAQRLLLKRMKRHIRHARSRTRIRNRDRVRQPSDLTNASMYVVIFSASDPENYDQHMEQLFKDPTTDQHKQDSGTSSCSSSHHSNSKHSSSSCNSSSCNSSSCSSSSSGSSSSCSSCGGGD